jgi:hypothetical protein
VNKVSRCSANQLDPGKSGIAPHRLALRHQQRLLAARQCVRCLRTRFALGAVGHLLHPPDARHRHGIIGEAERLLPGQRQVVDAERQARVWQLASRALSRARARERRLSGSQRRRACEREVDGLLERE